MKKNTFSKIALIISLLLIGVGILLGYTSTIAWFEDKDVAINKFVVGDMDIKFEYCLPKRTTETDENWLALTETTPIFNTSDLYEPGFTDIRYIKVTNQSKTDVSFKCDFTIWAEKEEVGKTEDGEDIYLKEHLKYGVVYGTYDEIRNLTASREDARKLATKDIKDIYVPDSKDKDNYKSTNKIGPGQSDYAAIIVYMPTTVGNEAMHGIGKAIPSIELGITVTATQAHD